MEVKLALIMLLDHWTISIILSMNIERNKRYRPRPIEFLLDLVPCYQ